MLPELWWQKLIWELTSSSKKRVGEAATDRCLFSTADGVTELTDEARTAIGVSAEAGVPLRCPFALPA